MRNTFACRRAALLGVSVLALVTAGQMLAADPPSYLISTVAGHPLPPTALAGTLASIGEPRALALDAAGNLYIATTLDVVFKLSPQGVLSRFAGSGAAPTGFLGDNLLAINANLNEPEGLAVDSLGNVYIADFGNGRIRKVTPDGIITTIAGNGSLGTSTGDGGLAVSAQLAGPLGLAMDTANNLYFADRDGNRIRKISINGIITSVAGTGTAGFSGDGGAATSAQLTRPSALAMDSAGNLYIGDDSYRIRRVSGGIISTIAGTGTMGYSGDGGPAAAAAIGAFAIALDSTGNLYLSDYQGHIRKINSAGTISTFAGDGRVGYFGDGGAAASATFYVPRGLAANSGNVYIADTGNQRVRRVNSGSISTVAGGFTGDGGPGPQAAFSGPSGIALDRAGNRYVADFWNHRIRKIAPDGTVTTVAGTGVMGGPVDGGPATAVQLGFPGAVALDSAGNLLIADSFNFALRKVNAAGIISTVLAGHIMSGFAVDSSDNIYFQENHRIYKLANGVITAFAGNGTNIFSGDNGLALNAGIAGPGNMAFDALGNLYVVDAEVHRIRKISTAGIITTVAGNGDATPSGEGVPATGTGIPVINGLASDTAGNLYFGMLNGVGMVDTSGTLRTIAGGPYGYSGDGGPSVGAAFKGTLGLAVAPNGNIYVADSGNHAIRMLTPVGARPVLTVTSAHNGPFIVGRYGTYNIIVVNPYGAAASSGAVTVRVNVANATLISLSVPEWSNWTCGGNSCTTSEVLLPGHGYPFTLVVSPPSSPTQITNLVTVSGGGGELAGSSDLTDVVAAVASLRVTETHQGDFPQPGQGRYTVVVSNAPGVDYAQVPVSVTEQLPPGTTLAGMNGDGWDCPLASLTCTHNVPLSSGMSYFPLYITINTTVATPASVTNRVVVSGVNSPSVSASDATNVIPCVTGLNPLTATVPAAGASGTIALSAVCSWSASSNAPWLTITSTASGDANTIVSYTAAPNPGAFRFAYITVGVLTFGLYQSAAGQALRFVPVTPCRIADTRGVTGTYGGPILAGTAARDFPIRGVCGVPSNAEAYSLNLTVVPPGPLGYLSVYPAGQVQPAVSTLNSTDGRVKANAAIVPGGINGAITLYANNATHAIIDINGYFVPALGNSDLQFYPVTPCRIADTRGAAGTSGGPLLTANGPRNFPIAGTCGIPATAQAFALNMTVVPPGALGYLSAWPAGQGQPGSSTLNAPTGTATANASIVPAGAGGAITALATNDTHLIIDVNGYFAPPGTGGMNFYVATPCRIVDTRGVLGPFGGPQLPASGSREFVVSAAGCNIPATAGAYSLNATVVPPAALGFLSLWGSGGLPSVSTLNAADGSVVANAAIVPASARGSVSAISSNATHLILDINGYFAQ